MAINENTVIRKDVTDQEIDALMRPYVADLMRFVVPRIRQGSNGQENCASETRKDKGKRNNGSKQEAITTEEREYLESILEKPNLSVTQRADVLSLSAYMSDKLKKSLVKKGFVEEFSLNLGHQTRGMVKFLELTADGYKALRKMPPQAREFQCSPEHWWWQKGICAQYRANGFPAEIEMELNGKRADVGFLRDGKKRDYPLDTTPTKMHIIFVTWI